MILGLSITVYVGARPLSSRKAIMRLRTPIILAAMPTQLSLWAINGSTIFSCARSNPSAVNIVICVSSEMSAFPLTNSHSVIPFSPYLRKIASSAKNSTAKPNASPYCTTHKTSFYSISNTHIFLHALISTEMLTYRKHLFWSHNYLTDPKSL